MHNHPFRPGSRPVLALMLAGGLAAAGGGAHAQAAAPGALFNLQAIHPGSISAYEQFGFSFIATLGVTAVSFSFRNDPAFFYLDDVTVVANGSSNNLLVNPSFEAGTLNALAPPGWSVALLPGAGRGGRIGSSADATRNYCNVAHAGSQLWCDGTSNAYDSLSQTIATTPGTNYAVSFWLGADASQVPQSLSANVYGYAQGVAVAVVPEPQTWVLLVWGGLALAIARRWHRSQSA